MSHWVKCSGFGCDNDADGHGHYYADYPGGGGGGAGRAGNVSAAPSAPPIVSRQTVRWEEGHLRIVMSPPPRPPDPDEPCAICKCGGGLEGLAGWQGQRLCRWCRALEELKPVRKGRERSPDGACGKTVVPRKNRSLLRHAVPLACAVMSVTDCLTGNWPAAGIMALACFGWLCVNRRARM